MPVLHRRPARHHPVAGPPDAGRQHPRGDGRPAGRRHRSRAQHHFQPEPGPRPRGIGLDLQLRRPPGLAEPDDPVQGEGGKEPRERVRRPVRLSQPDGRRHPLVPSHPRARGRGPETAPGADPRHRPEVQHGFRHRPLPPGRTPDFRRRDPRHVVARRHQEDEQVGGLGLFPHQHDRRRPRHRGQDPQGEDRSPSAAQKPGRLRGTARGGQPYGHLRRPGG